MFRGTRVPVSGLFENLPGRRHDRRSGSVAGPFDRTFGGNGLRARRSNLRNGADENGYAETMLAKSEIQREALDLPAQERIELVVELWDSLRRGRFRSPTGSGT